MNKPASAALPLAKQQIIGSYVDLRVTCSVSLGVLSWQRTVAREMTEPGERGREHADNARCT